MGRSVSVPTGATIVAYREFEQSLLAICETCGDPHWSDEQVTQCCGGELEYEGSHDQLCDDWDNLKLWVTEVCQEHWPSLWENPRHLNNEDFILLENHLAQIGVSEYCGLVSLWVVPTGDSTEYYSGENVTGLAEHWCNQIRNKFHTLFGELTKHGTASNGEAFFTRSN